jgi:hypothetical protein
MLDGGWLICQSHVSTMFDGDTECHRKRADDADAQVQAVRAVLHKPEHLWQCGCCTAVLDALGDDA